MAQQPGNSTATPDLVELEKEADARDKDWYFRIAAASIAFYILLQLTANLELTYRLLHTLNSLTNLSFAAIATWDIRTGIDNGEATAIVTALAAIIISVNVSAIMASLTPLRTESDEHAFYRWLSKMQFLAPIAASAAIAVACTRMGTDTGLGVGLLTVALIAMGASSLNAVVGTRRFSARVRLSNARREASAAAAHVANLESQLTTNSGRRWWKKVGSTYASSFITLLLVSSVLALETLVQCLAAFEWIFGAQIDTFLEVALSSAYLFLLNALTTGPLLHLIAWSCKWFYIVCARHPDRPGSNFAGRLTSVKKFIHPLLAVVVVGLVSVVGHVSPPPIDQLFTFSMLLTSCFFFVLVLAASRGKGPATIIPLHALAYLTAQQGSMAKTLKIAEELEAAAAIDVTPNDVKSKVGEKIALIKFWR